MPGTVKLIIDPVKMAKMLDVNGTLILYAYAKRVEAIAKQLAPVRTGALRDSIKVKVTHDAGIPIAFVGSDLDYAEWVNRGTGVYGPYGQPIYPHRGRYLVFATPAGEVVFAKSVSGQQGQHFLERALAAGFALGRL